MSFDINTTLNSGRSLVAVVMNGNTQVGSDYLLTESTNEPGFYYVQDIDTSTFGTGIYSVLIKNFVNGNVLGGATQEFINNLTREDYMKAQGDSIEADTNELQTNQGSWVTAVGFATPANVTDAQIAIVTEVNSNETKIDQIITDIGNLNDLDGAAIATAVWSAATRSLTDKTGFELTASERTAISVAVEAALINEGDGQQLIDAIVTMINANLDLPALELSAIATAVRTELTTELARIDTTISSRMDSASYTAPDNSGISQIQTDIGNLNDFDPTTEEVITDTASREASKADTSALASQSSVDAIPINPLLTNDNRLDNLDATISSRSVLTAGDVWSHVNRTLTSFSTLVADIWTNATRTLTAGTRDADIDAIKVKTDNLNFTGTDVQSVASNMRGTDGANTVVPDNAGISQIQTDIANLSIPTASSIATAVWTSVNRELTNIDKTGYSLTTTERDAIAVVVEAALLNDGDGQALIDAIVTMINNNLDLPALELQQIATAVRTELSTELSRIDTNITTRSTFDNLTDEVTTDLASRNASKADVSSLASQASVDAIHTPADVDALLTTNHGSGSWEQGVTGTVDANVIAIDNQSVTSPDDFKADITSIPSAVWSHVTRSLSSFGNIAEAVWTVPTTRTLTEGTRDSAIDNIQSDLTSIDGKINNIPTDPLKTDDSRLDNIDAPISSRSTLTSADVWNYASRTLTSFASLISGIWSHTDRTLTEGDTSADVASIKAKTDRIKFNSDDDVITTLDGEQVVASNMRGTDGANTVEPDNSGIASLLSNSATSTELNSIRDEIIDEINSNESRLDTLLTLVQNLENASVSDITNAVWTATVRSITDKTDFELSISEKENVATVVESHLLNDGDGQALLDALLQVINTNLDLPPLELQAIASAVRAELTLELSRIDAQISTRGSISNQHVINEGVKNSSKIIPHSQDTQND